LNAKLEASGCAARNLQRLRLQCADWCHRRASRAVNVISSCRLATFRKRSADAAAQSGIWQRRFVSVRRWIPL